MPFELADTLTPTEDDRLLQAEALVRSYCGWHIAPSRTDTITFTGRDSAVVLLPSLYVTSIVSVTFNGDLVDVADYVWATNGTLTWRPRWGCWTSLPLVVEYVHGYDEAPPDVTAVVQALAQRFIGNPAGLTSLTRGPFSETYGGGGISVDLLGSLSRYRLPPRP